MADVSSNIASRSSPLAWLASFFSSQSVLITSAGGTDIASTVGNTGV